MREIFLCVVLLAFVIPAGCISPLAATLCDQTFTVYGKTAGEHSTIFWDIFVGGECEHWMVYAFFVGYDREYQMSTWIDGGGKNWIPPFLEELPTEPVDTIADRDGKFFVNEEIYFTSPEPDSTFPRKWAGIQYESVKKWYCECPVNCSDYPVFHNAEANLLYEHNTGLYKNYGIKQAIYFPDSRYLVIMTDQPAKAIGLDEMNGLLIYRIYPHKKGGEQ